MSAYVLCATIAFATDFSEVFSLDPLAELQSLYYSKETVKILVFVVVRHAMQELNGDQSTPEHFVGLEGKDNVAIEYNHSDDLAYYLVQLAENPWHVVPKGEVRVSTTQLHRGALFSLLALLLLFLTQTLKCEGLYDKAGAFLELPEGSRVLHGFLYSLRNKKDRKYELWDVAFAGRNPKRLEACRLWTDFPHVYFPVEMLLHVKFHLAPASSHTARREPWCELHKHDHEAITTAAHATRE
jgi:hypothetical protein